MTALHLRSISKRYGDGPDVLASISLDIEPGELFFLLGPSGCGKSTLLRIIAGFLKPNEGHVLFGEEEVTELAPESRDTGMVFQSYALWPHMTVAQNVAFGLEVRKVPAAQRRERVMEALQMVGLKELHDRQIPSMSGGQQQRVALARAMVIRPRLLLLDEPLSNLDAKLRLEMRAEIRRICKETGLTTIYVTHDQKEALSMADRLAVLHKGHLIQVGKPRDVYHRPATRFVADFIGESNFLDGKILTNDGGRGQLETAWGTCTSNAIASELKAGQPCLISIRPESLKLHSQDPGDQPNAFSMTVSNSMYLGEIGQWMLRIADREVKVFELQPEPRSEGDQVTATVDPEDVVVLPGTSGA